MAARPSSSSAGPSLASSSASSLARSSSMGRGSEIFRFVLENQSVLLGERKIFFRYAVGLVIVIEKILGRIECVLQFLP